MIRVVSWNVGKREAPWRELVRMSREQLLHMIDVKTNVNSG